MQPHDQSIHALAFTPCTHSHLLHPTSSSASLPRRRMLEQGMEQKVQSAGCEGVDGVIGGHRYEDGRSCEQQGGEHPQTSRRRN